LSNLELARRIAHIFRLAAREAEAGQIEDAGDRVA
jgi:hypothetical protein